MDDGRCDETGPPVSRRAVLVGLGGSLGASLAGCRPSGAEASHTGPPGDPGAEPSRAERPDRPRPSGDPAEPRRTVPARLPVVYVPHGGGPWPFVDMGGGLAMGDLRSLEAYLRSLATLTPVPPRAVLVVSAHWEAAVPTVMVSPRPPMLYDYSGFPRAAYELTWPAPGHPELASRTRDLLERAGFGPGADPERGFDHGAFVVTKLAWPDATLPTFQLSLERGLDPARHLAMGRALAPLRSAGVLIVASGQSYHSFPGFRMAMRGNPEPARSDSRAFDGWLSESVALEPAARERQLVAWDRAPAARACHPREEHLLPLMVAAGAGGEDPGHIAWRGEVLGATSSAVQFG